jgi:all-trans-8'-apo-beta-carotenal 15,15'-oxygenase
MKAIPTPTPTSVHSIVSNPSSGMYDYNYWKKAFVSQLQEFDYEVTDIEGNIPIDLKGTLFRSFPARFERGDTAYGHYLDGDGYE